MDFVEYGVHDLQRASLEEIARANGFTMEDLAANRNGRIGASQQFRLFGRALDPVRYQAAVFGGWLLVWYLLTHVPGLRLLATVSWLTGGTMLSPAVFLGITALCGGMLLIAILQSARSIGLLVADLRRGEAVRIEGRMSVSREAHKDWSLASLWSSNARNMQYQFVIGQQYFTVDQIAGELELDPRSHYRIYYAPRSGLLLSVEPV